jgi:hypothetical protein
VRRELRALETIQRVDGLGLAVVQPSMRSTILAILFTLIAACTTTDDSTRGVESALEDPCTADESDFKNYDAVTACAKSNPALFQLAIGAIEKAGGTCTAVDEVKACTSIEPIDDQHTLELTGWPISCERTNCRPDPIAGLGYCTVECCISGFNGPICLKNDRMPR